MANTQKDLLKKATEFYAEYPQNQTDGELIQDQNYLNQKLQFFKDVAKETSIGKSDYALALVAFILKELQQSNSTDETNDVVPSFIKKYEVSEEDQAELKRFMDFLHSERDEQSKIEEILRDSQYLHLGMPDAFERLELQRLVEERKIGVNYADSEWLEKCKHYFVKHSFNCDYTIRKFGAIRSRNFIELEKRIDKLPGNGKEKNGNSERTELLSDKESEEMFKLAFRNSVNLISVADQKAGMLIQINTLLAGFVFTFGAAKIEENTYYLIPTTAILVGSALTVFFGILASRPMQRHFDAGKGYEREEIFFGSYDRLDSNARKVSWEKYSSDINELLKGAKKNVFDGLIKESYEVSKVLSRKFGFLSLAYKIFFAGLFLGIVGFLILMIYEYNLIEPHMQKLNTSNPF